MSQPDIKVILTDEYFHEKKYIFDVLIEDYLGLTYSIEIDQHATHYTLQKEGERVLIPDVFFANQYVVPIKTEPILAHVDIEIEGVSSPNLPFWFFREETPLGVIDNQNKTLPADIIGMAFFLLSGYADIHFSEKDEHQRNVGKTSFVATQNLIDRPIIQEWFIVLAQLLYGEEFIVSGKQVPGYTKHVSHDVDQPFEYLFYTKIRLVKRMVGDLVVRKSVSLAKKRFNKYMGIKSGDYDADPYNNFSELLEILRKEGVNSTFFFVSGDNSSEYDVLYDIEHPAIKYIIKNIHKAGHAIGLHPSYKTQHNGELLKKEVNKLEQVCALIGIEVNIDRSRKHYLRWDWEQTAEILQEAGIKHDYTVGYADRTGYRTGVAFPYRGFSWQNKKILTIKLHPLIIMEASLLSEKYMGLSLEQAKEKIIRYHNQLKQLGGEFVLLWHNNRLNDSNEMKLFLRFLIL